MGVGTAVAQAIPVMGLRIGMKFAPASAIIREATLERR